MNADATLESLDLDGIMPAHYSRTASVLGASDVFLPCLLFGC